MKDFQERVIIERQDLSDKVERLKKFIEGTSVFLSLPEYEKLLLRRQYGLMLQYEEVLAARIANFEGGSDASD